MRRAVLDTDIFSELLKRRDQTVVESGRRYVEQFGRFTLTTITIMEIVAGLRRAEQHGRIEPLTRAISQHEVLSLSQTNAVLAGQIYADLEARGQRIGVADTIIAAIAVGGRLELVTGNTKHYLRIVELGYPLKLSNWRLRAG